MTPRRPGSSSRSVQARGKVIAMAARCPDSCGSTMPRRWRGPERHRKPPPAAGGPGVWRCGCRPPPAARGGARVRRDPGRGRLRRREGSQDENQVGILRLRSRSKNRGGADNPRIRPVLPREQVCPMLSAVRPMVTTQREQTTVGPGWRPSGRGRRGAVEGGMSRHRGDAIRHRRWVPRVLGLDSAAHLPRPLRGPGKTKGPAQVYLTGPKVGDDLLSRDAVSSAAPA